MSKDVKDATSHTSPKETAFDIGAVPSDFGEGNDYWDRYYDLAQKQDAAGRKNMGAELDTLLIFGALFAGVSTAFVILSLPMLSAGPSDETNNYLRLMLLRNDSSSFTPEDLTPPAFTATAGSVRINCFFIASLSLSVISTFAAMLGKQWLAYAEKSEHGGSVRHRSLELQKRLSSEERWNLSIAFQGVSMLLQGSLVLFLIGLVELLWSIHRSPAWLSLSLSAAGTVLYIGTLFALWLDPYCPFQTRSMSHKRLRFITSAISYTLFNIIMSSVSIAIMLALVPLAVTVLLLLLVATSSYNLVRRMSNRSLFSLSDATRGFRTRMSKKMNRSITIASWLPHPLLKMSEEEAKVDSVRWLLSNTIDEETILQGVQNALAVRDFKAVARFSRTEGTKDWMHRELSARLDSIIEDQGDVKSEHILSDAAACKFLIQAFAHISLASISTSPWDPWSELMWWMVEGKDMVDKIHTLEPSSSPSDMDDITLFKLVCLSENCDQPDVVDYLPLVQRVDVACLRAFLATLPAPYGDRVSGLRRKRWAPAWHGQRRQIADAAAHVLLQKAGDDGAVLNLIAWTLDDIRDEDSLTFNKDGLPRMFLRPRWAHDRWNAYISDKDLLLNLAAALSAYPDHIEHAIKSIMQTLPSIMFNTVYFELLQKVRLLFTDPKAAKTHAGDLKANWPRLLLAMETILAPCCDQKSGVEDVEAEGRHFVRKEVIITMDALWALARVGRRDGEEVDGHAHVEGPSIGTLMRMTDWARTEDPECLAALISMFGAALEGPDAVSRELLPAQASTINLLVSTMTSNTNEIRLRGLAVMSTHAPIWFSQHDPHTIQLFRDADLPLAIVSSIRLHRDWASISTHILELVNPLVAWPEWRSSILDGLRDALSSMDPAESDCLTEAAVDIWLKVHQSVSSSTPDADSKMPAADANWTAFVMLPTISDYLWRRKAAASAPSLPDSFNEYLELMKSSPYSDSQTIAELSRQLLMVDGMKKVDSGMNIKP